MNKYGGLVGRYYQGKTKALGEKPVPLSLSPPQTPHVQAWDWAQVFAFTNQPLTTWAMALPTPCCELTVTHTSITNVSIGLHALSPFRKMSSLNTSTRCTAPMSPTFMLWLRVTLRTPGRQSRLGSWSRNVCFHLSLDRWIFWYWNEFVMSTLFVVKLGQFSQYSNYATGQMTWDLVPGSDKRFCHFPNCPDWLWWSLSSIFDAYQPKHKAYHSPKSSTKVKKEWSYLHLHWYAFMACTGATVSLPFTLFFQSYWKTSAQTEIQTQSLLSDNMKQMQWE